MGRKSLCTHCDRFVLAQWSYRPPHPALILLAVLSCGMLFPLLLLIRSSGYVCPRCMEDI